ncbi:MAG: hypothetical protein MJE12_06765, partial [Alphaproteobacteria bacterium]|nr:hypothetical protein [Alphaproteobacteria bacterium]
MAGSENDPHGDTTTVSAADVQAQLNRILTSADFAKSDRMSRFLAYVVEQTIEGHADRLKGYTIGIEVFDRPGDFDPQVDSIVRVEAGRLRDRLSRYYADEGAGDPVRIDIPKGSYTPRFQKAAGNAGATGESEVSGGPTRRLAAILSADAVAYSKRMERREEDTLAALKMCFDTVFRPEIREHGGRIVKLIGDGVLAEFTSVTAATQCAIEIQREIEELSAGLPANERLQFRIGVHLGDVIADADDIYGDGVNVAARIEKFAEPGGIAVSDSVYRQVQHHIDAAFQFLGNKRVRNISRPIGVYRSIGDRKGLRASLALLNRVRHTPSFRIATGAVFVLAIVLSLYAMQQPGGDPKGGSGTQADLLSLPSGPTIAVLPFDNMSGDERQDFFADGITEEIVSDLAQFRDLRVLGRNTTFRYKGTAVDIRALGRDLKADYILEGSVRRADDNVRVTAQLIETDSGSHVWANSFDRKLTPAAIIAVQDEISEKVVGALATPYGAIKQNRKTRPDHRAPETLGAYECILRYYAHARAPTAESHLTVRACLERAIAAEPDYAQAWAALALSRLDEFRIGLVPMTDDAEILDRTLSAAEQAVALDSQSALAHQALFLAQFHRGDIDNFRTTAMRALELNPNHADMIADYALCLILIGDDARGIALARKAIVLSPQDAPWYHAAPLLHHLRQGADEKALQHAKALDAGQF